MSASQPRSPALVYRPTPESRLVQTGPQTAFGPRYAAARTTSRPPGLDCQNAETWKDSEMFLSPNNWLDTKPQNTVHHRRAGRPPSLGLVRSACTVDRGGWLPRGPRPRALSLYGLVSRRIIYSFFHSEAEQSALPLLRDAIQYRDFKEIISTQIISGKPLILTDCCLSSIFNS